VLTKLLQPRRLFLLACGTLLLSLVLTSCGTTEQALSEVETTQTTETGGTRGQLISIQSDNVRAAGYDASSMIMTVQFNNGYTYAYYGIPLELWDSFIAAQPNPWSLVGYPRLVQAGVPYKRIN
jgi:KTSC domain